MYTLILLSGGQGKRMKNSIPKQYMLLAGKPVIMHSLEKVDSIEDIEEIIIVCDEAYKETIQCMIEQYGITKQVRFANSGKTRQDSVRSGLHLVTSDSVIIHESARPFVKKEDYEKLIKTEDKNVILGLSIPFTVAVGHMFFEQTLNRSELINVQLPQKFETDLLKKAHEMASLEGKQFTEDASMLFSYFPDSNIRICEGVEYNIKLTTRTDMIVGEQIYREYFGGKK